MPHDLARQHGESIIWSYDLEPLKVSHHPYKVGGNRHYGSRDIMVLVCWRDGHMVSWVGAHQGKSSSCQIWWPQSLWKLSHNGFSSSRDIARSRDERVNWFYWWEPLMVSYHPSLVTAKFGAIGIVVVEIWFF